MGIVTRYYTGTVVVHVFVHQTLLNNLWSLQPQSQPDINLLKFLVPFLSPVAVVETYFRINRIQNGEAGTKGFELEFFDLHM